MAVGGAGIFAATLPGRTATPSMAVPTVDRLSLQIVTDSGTFGPFLDSLTLPGMTVTRAGNGGGNGPRMLPTALLGEFGLSIVGTSEVASVRRTVMVDFGYSAPVLANNLRLLGVDPDKIDAAVLSHGHLDHYGGFKGLDAAGRKASHRLPLIVGGEETFCERIALIGNPPPIMGTLDRGALSHAGFDVRIDPKPLVVADHAFTTGIIPLNSFERAAIPTQMRPGVGCDRKLIAPAKRDATLIADDGEHELATCYAIKGLGLVVIASCSHRGVLNSVRRAQAVSGIDKVHAVIGGFHLVRPRTEDEARRTVAEFARIDPTYIIPMHCTGEVFIAEALRLMPQKVVRSYVGSKFDFAA
jgi:7,8-dihydropterin-6-yl-methyl-4-(beta-D-ribofuranosyl)aminobenzene 5'-phosphate synthase